MTNELNLANYAKKSDLSTTSWVDTNTLASYLDLADTEKSVDVKGL